VRVASTQGIGSLRVGALVNARGQITRTEQGGLEVIVDDLQAIRVLDSATSLATSSAPALNAQVALNLPTAAAVDAAPASTTVPILIGGLLALALGVAAAGVVIARRPDLLRSAMRAVAVLRTGK